MSGSTLPCTLPVTLSPAGPSAPLVRFIATVAFEDRTSVVLHEDRTAVVSPDPTI